MKKIEPETFRAELSKRGLTHERAAELLGLCRSSVEKRLTGVIAVKREEMKLLAKLPAFKPVCKCCGKPL